MNQLKSELRQMMDQLMMGEDSVSAWIKNSQTIQSLKRLPGDASARKYYRIISNAKSYILMFMGPFSDQEDSIPFLTVQKYLFDFGIAVPEVLDVCPEKGFILLEDLGDITLLRKLQDVSNPGTERQCYEKVIDLLVQFQVGASPVFRVENQNKSKEKALDAFNLKFDHEKLMWEVNFTIDNFYKHYLKRDILESDLKSVVNEFGEICGFLAEQPTVLAHRDFHSRNIMIAPTDQGVDRFVMIDFQDARMGPAQYDLSSLLKDSYYQLEESQVTILIDYYISRYEAITQQSIDRSHFLCVFDLMGVQRNFKAIGSFASFMNKRGDSSYLKYIGNTFENIRRTLLKYPKYSNLREILFHYYYF